MGGGAPPPKQEELQPHPAKEQLPNIAYCITSPPPWRQFSFFFFFLLLYTLDVCMYVFRCEYIQ